MYNKIPTYQEFINENNNQEYSYQYIIDYITDITPNFSDVPDYFFSILKRDKPTFQRKELRVDDILRNDRDVKEYVLSGEDRYGGDYDDIDYTPYEDELDLPIVIYNDEVFDGYSRLSEHYRRGIKTIIAYTNK